MIFCFYFDGNDSLKIGPEIGDAFRTTIHCVHIGYPKIMILSEIGVMLRAPEYKFGLHNIIRYLDHVHRYIDLGYRYRYMYLAPEYKCKMRSTIRCIDMYSI